VILLLDLEEKREKPFLGLDTFTGVTGALTAGEEEFGRAPAIFFVDFGLGSDNRAALVEFTRLVTG
jgi:hypothetical protein